MELDEMSWNDFVERVKSQTDIIGVISRYVDLKPRGDRFWGLCPFHGEKTPSFSVSPSRGLFYCFGCHTGGDAFKFISLIEKVTYGAAIKIQAERLGIELPQRDLTPEERRRIQLRKDLLEVNARARNFFHNALTITSYGKAGLEYLHGRNFSAETIENFSIGFAPNAWSMLSIAFQDRGFSKDLLLTAGLILPSKKYPDRTFDRFRNRVIIPISDERSRVVGFGGRSIDETEPKYLNSNETPVFNKRRILFGLDKSAQAIGQKNFAVICEGYMDAISLFSAGIENVVATLGTAFTEDHAKLLSRYTRRFFFCYDSDSAGQNATLRAIPIAENQNAEVRIISISDGKDPDEFIKSHGREKFEALIEKSLTAFEFQLQRVKSQMQDQSIENRAVTFRTLLPIISTSDLIKRREYVRRAAMEFFIDENDINREIEKYLRSRKENSKENSFQQRIIQKPNEIHRVQSRAILSAGQNVLSSLLDDSSLVSYVEELLPNGFDDPIHREIFLHIKDPERRLSNAAMNELALISNLPSENKIQAFHDSMKKLRIEYLKQLRRKISDTNSKEYFAIQKEINDFNSK